jgi:hypothetical protein
MLQYRWKCKAIIVFIVVWTFGMVYIEFICSKWIFHFISEFSWWFVFIKSLTCSSCYVAFTFFSITKTYFAPHLKYSVFLLSDWKKLLRLNDWSIPAIMDADFPEIQTCFFHNMKKLGYWCAITVSFKVTYVV